MGHRRSVHLYCGHSRACASRRTRTAAQYISASFFAPAAFTSTSSLKKTDVKPKLPTTALPSLFRHLLHPDRLERPRATSSRHLDRFALSVNPSGANATLSLLRLSFKNSNPASPWKTGNAGSGKSEHVGPLRPSQTLWILTLSLCPGPSGPLPPLVFWSLVLESPHPSARVVSEARARVRFACPSHVSCVAQGSV